MTMVDLANSIEKNDDIKDEVAFRDNGRIVRKDRPPIKDLDGLPFPDRNLLDEEYLSEVIGIKTSSGKFTTMVTSRGCPYECKYCACLSFTSRTVRLRSPENVVDEMEMLWSDGYEEVGLVDDNFLVNRKRVERICYMIMERKIKLNLWLQGRGDQASLDTMKKLAKAGCKAIYFGIESGNEHVLRYYGKSITPDICRGAVSNAKKSEIDAVIGSFIIGAPIETREDVENTFRFAMSLDGMDFPQMNILYLSPGMGLWRDAVSGGYLEEDVFWDTPVPAVNVYPSRLNIAELENMVGDFYDRFLRRKSYIAIQAMRTLMSSWRLKILTKNFNMRNLRVSLKHLKGD